MASEADASWMEKLKGLETQDPFRLVGLQVVAAAPKWAKLRLPFRKDLVQAAGVIHGGFLATLVDSAIAIATMTTLAEGEGTSTADLKVNYLRPVRSGDVVAEATVLYRGRTTAFSTCELFNEQTGEQVAHGEALYMIFPARPQQA
ncbi:MAG: PaaI family thioesterase [Firmicutes bacterium]|nr:PaaI family thioesterase [Bacillota bacterium]